MSPSSILLKVIWDENGGVVSFIRSLVLMCFVSFVCYVAFTELLYFNYLMCVECLLTFIHRISNPFDYVPVQPPKIWENDKKSDSEIFVQTMMGSLKLRSTIEMCFDKCGIFAGSVIGWFKNRILKTLARLTFSILAVLFCFVYVCVLFCVSRFRRLILCPIWVILGGFSLISGIKPSDNDFQSTGSYFIFFMVVLGWIMFSIESFLLGLFLNLIFFIPYLAFFSVLTFYCYTCWKTMEEKYFVLKQLIYEACRETQNLNNACIPNRHPKPNEEVLPVVSKELYDKIREKLLPYDMNLFYFGLKMVWSIAFSFGIFELINTLNRYSASGLVQVVTTASLGVMPYIFNMVGSKTSEAKTKAWNEKLKQNVKYMVEDLTREDPGLAQTLLITEKEMKENDYATANNLSIVEKNIQYETSVWCISSVLNILKSFQF